MRRVFFPAFPAHETRAALRSPLELKNFLRALRARRAFFSASSAPGARTHLRPPLEKFSPRAARTRGAVASQRSPHLGRAPTSVCRLRNFLRAPPARAARLLLNVPRTWGAHPAPSAAWFVEKFSPRRALRARRDCVSATPAYGVRTQPRLPRGKSSPRAARLLLNVPRKWGACPSTPVAWKIFSARCAHGKVVSRRSPHMGRARPPSVCRLKIFLRARARRKCFSAFPTHGARTAPLRLPLEKFSPRAARAASLFLSVPHTWGAHGPSPSAS